MGEIDIRLTTGAEREFERPDRGAQQRVAAAIEVLREKAAKPRPGLDVRPLKGLKGMWRLRVGDYRGIFQREGSTLTFTRSAHRFRDY